MRAQFIPFAFALAALTSGVAVAAPAHSNGANMHGQVVLNAALRDLWLGHVFWVRNVVTANLSGDAAAATVAEEQAVANAKAIAAAIKPFYGEDAQKALFGLLAGHYGAVKGILDAAISKDADKTAKSTQDLLSNAGEIAEFLSGANPHLPKEAVVGLLQAHGGHHIAQIQQLQNKDYKGEAQTWSEMTNHMYVIADALGNAIAKQFPDKVSAN